MWGADSEINNKISVTIEEMSSKGLGVEGLKVDTEDDATVSIDTISAKQSRKFLPSVLLSVLFRTD